MPKDPLCPICQSAIAETDATTACSTCDTRYHQECWEMNEGCGLYGCTQAPETVKWDEHEVPVAYWGKETKTCPQCAQEIRATALRCVHCGSVFKSARPEKAEQFREDRGFEEKASGVRRGVVVLFILNLLFFTAPLGFLGGGLWALLNRRFIPRLSGAYRALCLIGLAVGALQTLAILGLSLLG